MSRQSFKTEAEKLTIVGGKPQPQFTEHFVANEKFPRYSKFELVEYLFVPHPAQHAVAAPDRPAFQMAC